MQRVRGGPSAGARHDEGGGTAALVLQPAVARGAQRFLDAARGRGGGGGEHERGPAAAEEGEGEEAPPTPSASSSGHDFAEVFACCSASDELTTTTTDLQPRKFAIAQLLCVLRTWDGDRLSN